MTEEWTMQKEKRALRRYRFNLTLKVIQVVFALVLLSLIVTTVYAVGINAFYNNSSKSNKLLAYAQLSVDWVYPGINSSISRNSQAEISLLLKQRLSLPLYRQVGNKDIEIGELQVAKPLLSDAQMQYNFYPNEETAFKFYLPEHPETGVVLKANQPRGVWETLEKVHEGTVADLAFSTRSYLTPEEMFELLEPFDLKINWMALYMGELKTFDEGWVGSSSGDTKDNYDYTYHDVYDSISIYPWGLTHGSHYDEDYFRSSVYSLSYKHLEEIQQRMLDNMTRLYQDDPKLAEAMFHTRHFKERLEFLQECGFVVYGAVVTGPTKELLRLQELDEIHGIHLGSITYWNWVD